MAGVIWNLAMWSISQTDATANKITSLEFVWMDLDKRTLFIEIYSHL
jgi:hypothetical protein